MRESLIQLEHICQSHGVDEIKKHAYFILDIHHKISSLIAFEYHLFYYTFNFFYRMRESLIQLEHICQSHGVDVKMS